MTSIFSFTLLLMALSSEAIQRKGESICTYLYIHIHLYNSVNSESSWAFSELLCIKVCFFKRQLLFSRGYNICFPPSHEPNERCDTF